MHELILKLMVQVCLHRRIQLVLDLEFYDDPEALILDTLMYG